MIQRGRWLILVVLLFLAACSTSSPPLGPVTVSVTPSEATLAPGETREFTAVVSGTPDTDVTWTTTGGTITGTGNTVSYTAPEEEGSYTLTATSQADPGKQATATVTVSSTPVEEISVAINPTSVTLAPGATRSFSATVTGTDDTGVTWSATGGSIAGSSTTITYTAPLAEGTYTVTATSQADPSKSVTATVTVRSDAPPVTECEYVPAEPISEACTAVLESRPRAVKDPSMFSTAWFPDAEPMVPAQRGAWTEEEALALLEELTPDPQKREERLAIFNDARLKRKVANPSLRFAYAFADRPDRVDYILNAKEPRGWDLVWNVIFDQPNIEGALAEARVNRATGTITIAVNEKFIGEDPRWLIPLVVGHEPLHQDAQNSQLEEIVATLTDHKATLDVILANPELAQERTELAREMLSRLVLLVNSGQGTRINVVDDMGQPLVPDSNQAASNLIEHIKQLYSHLDTNPMPGNPQIAADWPDCEAYAGQFSEELISCINDMIGRDITEHDILQVMQLLKMDMKVEQPATLANGQNVTLSLDGQTARETGFLGWRPAAAAKKAG